MKRSLPVLSAIATLLVPLVASAQQPPPPPTPGASPGHMYGAYGQSVPGYHEHDGFFFRLGMGVGYTAMAAEDEGMDISVGGSGGAFLLALGANLSPGFIIYGELIGDVALNPTIEIDG